MTQPEAAKPKRDLMADSRDLRAKLQRYEALTESAYDLVAEVDQNGTLLYLSPNVRDVLGWIPEEYVGTSGFDTVCPDDRVRAIAELTQTLQSGKGRIEARVEHADRTWRELEITGRLYQTSENASRIVLICRDVTEHRRAQEQLRLAHESLELRVKERTAQLDQLVETWTREVQVRRDAEQQLRESEQMWRILVENAPEFIMLFQPDGTLSYVNRLKEGLTMNDVVGAPGTNFVAPDHEKLMRDTLNEVFATGRPGSYEAQDNISGAWYSTRLGPIVRDGKVEAVIGIATDITAQRRDKESLARARDELEARVAHRTEELADANVRLQRDRERLQQLLDLQERDRKLIAYEVHDGLVQYMIGATMHLEAARAAMHDLRDDVKRNCENGMRLLQDAIGEARRLINGLRPPILDEAGIVAAIEHLIEDANEMADVRVEFRHDDVSERLATTLENAMFRIIQEALSNVRRHSESRRAEVELFKRDGQIHISVRDWGIGFDVDAVGSGHFGLTGMRERAGLLGGSAVIESTPGVGTVVRAVLPATQSFHAPRTEGAAG